MTDQALKAAVERVTAQVEARDAYCITVLHEDLRTLLAALSSQASVMEEMAENISGPSAWLDRWARHVGGCHGGDQGEVCTCGLSMAQHEARTALSQYRTLGDRHDD